ncbi:MAG: hypothetical protein PHP14_03730 [Candidatus Pacebacteria bacterium]|nr:hypothetical protein [Candidatus Paceibacterota bacterium]
MPVINQTVNLTNGGIPIGKAYREAYDNFLNALNPEYKYIQKVPPGTFRIYGPPETTLKNIVETPNVNIRPETSSSNQIHTIKIPKGKFETSFILKNIGKVDVNYSFDNNNYIDISPISGTLSPSQEQKITLKVSNNRVNSIETSSNIQSNLKPKSTTLYFKSNAGNKDLSVIY